MATILIVDDDNNYLEYVHLLLDEYGHTILIASDGIKAIAEIQKTQDIGLIITDMQMPPGEWGGLWLIEQVKKLSNLPIIVLSERGTVSKAVEAMKNGANDYVEKLRIEEDLISVVEKTLLNIKINKKDDLKQVSSYFPILSNSLGPIWDKLTEKTKIYIANAENIYHNNSHDTDFDFSVGIVELAKALECECNVKLISILKNFNEKQPTSAQITVRMVNGVDIPIHHAKSNLTLGQLTYVLKHLIFQKFCFQNNISYSTIQELLRFLTDLKKRYRRNDAVHNEFIDIRTFELLRAKILGLGQVSPLNYLVEIQNKENKG